MHDMKRAGAVAFTDDRRPVSDSGLLLRALQYTKNIDSLVISYADDKSISGKGQVNEGVASTMSGLKGMPAFAEELMVNRDLRICEYTGGRLHFSTISTAAAVEMIRQAKAKGLPVTAEVCAHQLFFDDSVILDYDTNFKVKPPFRSQSDIEALKKGLVDGTIDVICSDHCPEDAESKVVEFDFASYGIAGIETAYAVANTALGNESSTAIPEIKEGAIANLTVFDPSLEWIPTATDSKSKSKNNPFFGFKLKGKAIAVFNNGFFKRCSEVNSSVKVKD
jgi:dihydroorotase